MFDKTQVSADRVLSYLSNSEFSAFPLAVTQRPTMQC